VALAKKVCTAAAAGVVPTRFAIGQKAKLKIGLMLPYTGTFAALGNNITDAMNLRLAELGERLHQFDAVVSCTASSLPIIGLGALVASLPWLAEAGRIRSEVPLDFAAAGPWYGIAIVAMGLALLARTRDAAEAVPRLGLASLLATAVLHLQFSVSAWARYDLAPVAEVLAGYAAEGRTIANRGIYEGQYHFLARLTAPVAEIDYHSGPDFARENPDAIVVDYVEVERPADWPGPAPIFTKPFRGDWIEVWHAADWLATGQAGGPPAYAADPSP